MLIRFWSSVVDAFRLQDFPLPSVNPFSGRYNDFDIILTHISSRASTNAVTAVPCDVVYITLLDTFFLSFSC